MAYVIHLPTEQTEARQEPRVRVRMKTPGGRKALSARRAKSRKRIAV